MVKNKIVVLFKRERIVHDTVLYTYLEIYHF